MNSDTYEWKFDFNLSPLNVFIALGLVAIFSFLLGVGLIVLTPLKEFTPGYTDVSMRNNALKTLLKADELENELASKEIYFQNLKNIIEGKIDTATLVLKKDSLLKNYNISNKKSEADSILRNQIESEDNYSIKAKSAEDEKNKGIRSFIFFPPVKGIVSNKFDALKEHFAVDVVAKENEPIKATLDGTVIAAGWTIENGYIMQIQHSNNLISSYKHNSVLLKKIGDNVQAGEVIAIIGNTGELTTGTHLHFELWYNGIPLNPEDYIIF